jgi:hypothetical protein
VKLGESPEDVNVAAAKEIGRQAWGREWVQSLLHDTRYAFRRLRRDRGFTITVLLTLALGIGANLAFFQILYSVVLAGLPVSHPEDLVEVHAAPTPFDQDWTVPIPHTNVSAQLSRGLDACPCQWRPGQP